MVFTGTGDFKTDNDARRYASQKWLNVNTPIKGRRNRPSKRNNYLPVES